MSSFKNELGYQEFVYDFSEKGGAVSTINLGALPVGAIVSEVVAWVETACTSDGSATVTWGNNDVDGYSGATIAVASLTANAVFNGVDNAAALLWDDTNDHKIHYRIANSTTAAFNVAIATAALTAGRIVFMVSYYMPA